MNMQQNKIGIFDSGLGGLVITKAILKKLPRYNYVYFGDTKNLPYGEKSQKQIYNLTIKGLEFLFKQNCSLVIIACNTASAKALRKIQQEFLPKHFPNKKVLGVIVPTIEDISHSSDPLKSVGVLCTTSTARSHAYKKEIQKINPKLKVFEQAAPKLVPMIENDTLELVNIKLKQYVSKLLSQKVDALVLGCTHYPILKTNIQKLVGKKVKVVSQEDIIPAKLELYLKKHLEITKTLLKNSKRDYYVTKINPNFQIVANRLFGKKINLKQIDLSR